MPCSHSHNSDSQHHSHENGEEQAALLDALKGQGDKGSLVTLIGLGSNVRNHSNPFYTKSFLL